METDLPPASSLSTTVEGAASSEIVPAPDLGPVIEAFRAKAAVVIAAKKSPGTRRGFTSDLALWLLFCASHGVDPHQATLGDATLFRDELVGKRAGATNARTLCALASVYRVLLAHRAVAWDPFDSKLLPRPDSSARRPAALIEEQDFQRLLAAAGADPSPSRALRDRTILVVLWWTGLRRAEVAALRADDLREEGREDGTTVLVARVTIKGGRTMEVEIAAPAATAIHYWIAYASISTGPLFPSSRGGRAVGGPAIYEMICARARQAGITARITPHGFRATVVTAALDAGAPLHEVAALVGHRRLETTGRYDRRRRGARAIEALLLARAETPLR